MATPASTTYSVASGAAGYCGRVPIVPTAPFQIAPPAVFWTQFSRPPARHARGYTFFGWTNEHGDTLIGSFRHATRKQLTFTLAEGDGTANGHDSCVIFIRTDGRLLATWATHNGAQYSRISTNPYDVTAWGDTEEIATSSPVSYSTLVDLGDDYVALHYRTGNGGGPGDRPCRARFSHDGGETWGVERAWINQPDERPYVMSAGKRDAGRIEFFYTSKHQTDEGATPFNLYHSRALIGEGDVESWFASDDTPLGAGPIEPTTDGTLIWDGTTQPGWIWDIAIGDDDQPRLLWMKMVGDDDHRHMLSLFDGEAWTHIEIGEEGDRLYSTEPWSDGALCFDAINKDIIYRGVQVDSAWEMQQWRIDGVTPSKVRDITVGSVPGFKNFQPFSPPISDEEDDEYAALLYLRGTITHWDAFATSGQCVSAFERSS